MQLTHRTRTRHKVHVLADNSLGCFVGTSDGGIITVELCGARGVYTLAMQRAEATRLSEELAEQVVNGSPSGVATIL